MTKVLSKLLVMVSSLALVAGVMFVGATTANADAGDTWTQRTTPNFGSDNNSLWDVACPSATLCIAVGYYDSGTADKTLVQRSTNGGQSWTIIPTDNAGGPSANNRLSSVSCSSTSHCVAVGGFDDKTLVLESSNGGLNWSHAASPNTDGADQNALYSVSCPTSSLCVAAGIYVQSSTGHPLVMRSINGGVNWTLTPPTPSGTGELWGIDCASSAACVAVGTVNVGGVSKTLVFRTTNSGASWAQVASPNNDSFVHNGLKGVSCAGGTCTAVGAASSDDAKTLILRSNNAGANWSVQPSSNSGSGTNVLVGVSCSASTFCTAAGTQQVGSSTQPLALRTTNSGASWGVQTTTHITPEATLRRISCPTNFQCAAVGDQGTNPNLETLAFTFAGTPAPAPSPVTPTLKPLKPVALKVKGNQNAKKYKATWGKPSTANGRNILGYVYNVKRNGKSKKISSGSLGARAKSFTVTRAKLMRGLPRSLRSKRGKVVKFKVTVAAYNTKGVGPASTKIFKMKIR